MNWLQRFCAWAFNTQFVELFYIDGAARRLVARTYHKHGRWLVNSYMGGERGLRPQGRIEFPVPNDGIVSDILHWRPLTGRIALFY
jgi:hypothetical protein